MKYAVLKTGGKQYKVFEGMEIEVEKIESDANRDIKLDKILLYVEEGNFQLGRPYIDGATITARVLEQKKSKKVRVAKFKAKARYRKVHGHRQMLTKLLIEKITLGNKKEIKIAKGKNK